MRTAPAARPAVASKQQAPADPIWSAPPDGQLLTTEPVDDPTTMPLAPAELDDPTVVGAVATATYFLSLFPYMYETDDILGYENAKYDGGLTVTSLLGQARTSYVMTLEPAVGGGWTVRELREQAEP